MLDLARADADGECGEGAVGTGVAVPADDRHARQRGALLRPDDMHDPLPMVLHAEIGLHMELAHVLVERLDLQARDGIGDALVAVGRGDVVVGGRDHRADAPRLAMGNFQALERLRARHLVHEVAVDVKKRRPVRILADEMRIPEFFVESTDGH